MDDTLSDDFIREAAYYIWEQEGRPDGLDFEHWVRAKAEAGAKSKKEKAPATAAKKTAAEKPVEAKKAAAPAKKPAAKKK